MTPNTGSTQCGDLRRPELSVVTTMYRSERFVRDFYSRMRAAAEAVTPDFELVFVDDGSPDESASIVRELARCDDRVVLVSLSRNFGHHKAILAGLAEATGSRVFLIDCDLEEQPEWLKDFDARLRSSDADVIYGVQENRTGRLGNRVFVGSFYRIFNWLSEVRIPANLCTVRLMTDTYVAALLSLKDKNVFLGGNAAWAGFRQQPLPVQKTRRSGASTYTPAKMLGLLVNAITSFTAYPLQAIFVIGFVMSTVSALFGLEILIRKLTEPHTVQLGYASIMVSIWFIGGLLIFFTGVIGIYLAKIFAEVKERPLYIVREVLRPRPRKAAI
jgi:putative glycosyltransferase